MSDDKKSTAVTTASAQLPAHMQAADLEQFAGLGNSTSSQDNTLPFLAIIQKGSPQINKQEPEYIKGAEVGMLLNTATGQLFSGEEGVVVIPCGFQKAYVEWVPRSAGGGYVATHPFDLEVARKLGAKKSEVGGLVLPNGNQLVETAYTFALVDGVPVVIGAASTALKPMRDWMSLRNAKRLPNGSSLPSFACQYRLRTVYQKNDKGDWYNWKIEDGGFVMDAGIFEMAKQFAIAVQQGQVQVGRPDEFDSAAGDVGDDRDIPV